MLSSPDPLDLSSSTEVSQYQNTGTRRPEKSLLQWEVAAPSANMPVYLTNPGNCQIKALFGKINDRLGVMKEVAAWKSINNKPTEDLEQEKRVLAAAQQMAIEHKIDPKTWEVFIQAQMDAAKEIQDNYRSQWQENNEKPPTGCRSIEQSRKDIADIGKEILSLMANSLTSQLKVEEARDLFIDSLTTEKLSDTTKENLFKALADVRLAPDTVMVGHVVVP